MPQISVIVPVYKAEKYIHRCLDSILAQTFTDWECLLIDDGSPDNSGNICDGYAERDQRFRVFHKKNGGVSSARNVGIDNAVGEFSIHCDPDDWMDTYMLQELYVKAKEDNADMVICDFIMHSTNKNIRRNCCPSELKCEAILKSIFQQNFFASCWNKLIKCECYKSRNLHFPEDMTMWEDQFFISNLMYDNHLIISYSEKAVYHYDVIINPNSIMNKTRSKKVIQSQEKYIDYFSDKVASDDLIVCKISAKLGAYKEKFIVGEGVVDYYPEVNGVLLSWKYNWTELWSQSLRLTVKYPQLYGLIYFVVSTLYNIKVFCSRQIVYPFRKITSNN